jgi:hypothetical protein
MRALRTAHPLSLTRLEDRHTPAQFGTPWADPAHLTLSFAPDGTAAVGGATSGLFAALDAQMARADWQGAILRAAQTWAEAAGVNVGLTADGGQAFGATGPAQGDPRFGDLRIGGLPTRPRRISHDGVGRRRHFAGRVYPPPECHRRPHRPSVE